MSIRIFFLSLFMFSLQSAWAQNSPIFSHYMFMKQLYNPASVGADNKLDVALLYRTQWVGVNGNPQVQALSIQSPLTFLNSSAAIYATNEMQGEERATSVMLSYAYRIPFKKSSLAIGASGGVIQRSFDGLKLRAPDGNYESGGVDHNDNFIPNTLTKDLTGDINAGVYFETKTIYAGASANNLLESAVNIQGQAQGTEIKNPRFFTAMGGYRLKLGRKLNLLPSVIVHTDITNTQAEVSTILQFKDNMYAGASFRGFTQDIRDALVVMFGFKVLKKIGIGYSYDFSLSSLNVVSNGSHEVYLRYSMDIKELFNPGKVIYNPRFL